MRRQQLARRGTPFVGALYAGLMLTPRGPRVLEFNCRLGDPEAQAILLKLRSDPFPLLLACAQALIYVGRTLEAVEVLRGALDGANRVGERMRWRLEGHLIIAAEHTPERKYPAAPKEGASDYVR